MIGILAVLTSLLAAWMSGTPLSEPRSEVAAAPLGGRIVVVGGFLSSGANSRRVDAYDPVRDAWTRLPDLPVSVDHAAAASVRGRLVVVGGYGADRQPLPRQRLAGPCGSSAGGRETGSRPRCSRSICERCAGGPREHLAATALGGKVYALGGRLAGYDSNFATVEAYDPGTNRWRRLPDLPTPRGGTGAAAIAGRIVSVGGESPQGTERSVWALRPSARRWVRLPDLPTPRHGLGVVAVGGRVWVVAGGPEPGLTVSGAVESLPVARS